jgi:hypothetical protein
VHVFHKPKATGVVGISVVYQISNFNFAILREIFDKGLYKFLEQIFSKAKMGKFKNRKMERWGNVS